MKVKYKDKPKKDKVSKRNKNTYFDAENEVQLKKGQKMRRNEKIGYTFLGKMKNVISLYDELIFCKLVKQDSANCRRISKVENTVGVDFLGTYDDDNITYYYTVDKLPRELFMDWKERLRGECKGGVCITYLNDIRRHSIAWESPQMQSRLRILRQVSEEEDEKDVDAYNLHKNIRDRNKQDWIEESLLYLSDADKQRGRALFKSTLFMIISGKRGDDFDDSVKLIEEYAKHIDLKLNRVMFDIPDTLSYFSPFSHSFNRDVVDNVPSSVLTDELLSRFNTYTQGTLGVSGFYFGTDIYSKFPVLKRVKPKEDTAENWLITSETGGGKSFFVKALVLQLLAKNYNGTIMDVEGFEYLPLAHFMAENGDSVVEIINMGEGTGKYFDPVEIAQETGLPEIDRDSKQLSLNFTLSILKVLLGRVYDEDSWMDTVLNDAVSETYRDAGVTENPKTWKNSSNLSLFDVYETLTRLEDFRDDDGYKSAVKQSVAITSKFFDEDGTRASLFQEKLRVSDIAGADLIICSFGMAGKSQQSVDDVQMALMQLGAAQLSHQRSIFSKAQGKYNFKLWEEFQRWGKFPGSDKTLGVALTGGRKLGDVNIIITNVIKELLDDDRFGVFGNTTSFLVGAIGDEQVRHEFCDRMTIPNMKVEMDLLSSAKKDDDEVRGAIYTESLFTHAFLCGLDRSKYGIVKMLLPADVAKSNLFKAGIDLAPVETDSDGDSDDE